MTIDKDFKEGLEELRHRVENPNALPSIHLVGSNYRQRDIRQTQTLKFPPWEIGYQVLQMPDMGGVFVRNIFFKLPGEKIDDLKNDDVDWILLHAKVLMDEGQGPPVIDKINTDCMKISQYFMPLLRMEKNPNILVPGGTGH